MNSTFARYAIAIFALCTLFASLPKPKPPPPPPPKITEEIVVLPANGTVTVKKEFACYVDSLNDETAKQIDRVGGLREVTYTSKLANSVKFRFTSYGDAGGRNCKEDFEILKAQGKLY